MNINTIYKPDDFESSYPYTDRDMQGILYEALVTAYRLYGNKAVLGVVKEANNSFKGFAGIRKSDSEGIAESYVLRSMDTQSYLLKNEDIYPSKKYQQDITEFDLFEIGNIDSVDYREIFNLQIGDRVVSSTCESKMSLPQHIYDRFFYYTYLNYSIYFATINEGDTLQIHKSQVEDAIVIEKDATIETVFGKYYNVDVIEIDDNYNITYELADIQSEKKPSTVISMILKGYIVPDLRRNQTVPNQNQ